MTKLQEVIIEIFMRRYKEHRGAARSGGMGTLGQALEGWLARHGGGERLALCLLWKGWEEIMGPDVVGLALPLGHRNTALLLGAEDNLAMQDLTFFGPEILRRANAFMERQGHAEFFARVEAHLVLGRQTLGQEGAIRQIAPPAPRPRLKGTAILPPGPARDCYEALLRAEGGTAPNTSSQPGAC